MSRYALVCLLLAGCQTQHHEWESWAIQGKYSQLDCKNQPGTYPFYVESEGVEFFLECR